MTDKKNKILIVDDTETFLRLEKMLLERSGYDIIMAKNGTEAIKKIQMEKPGLVFCDMMMPDMNGDVVCKFVKSNKSLKHIPIIMVTTRSDPESVERCKRAGCDDYITKPVTQRDLFAKIKKFLSVERRIFPRAILRVTATGTGESSAFSDFTYDVSKCGVFVETQKLTPVGTPLDLEFKLPDEPEPVRVAGRVVRTIKPDQSSQEKPAGIGIVFLEILPADTIKIRRYVNTKID